MLFEIKALRDGRDVMALSLDAADAADAAGQAQAKGYTVLSVRRRQSLPAWKLWGGSGFSLVLFSQEMLALLEAGLTLVEGIEAMAEKEHRPENRKMLQQIIAQLYEGRPLSHALQQFPAVFPALYVATVRASEKTGDLGEALARYIAYQTQMDVVRKKIISASIYPVLLMTAGLLVTLFLMFYVVPKFSRIYEDMGSDLPFLSRLLMEWGKLLEAHQATVLVSVLCMAGFAAYGISLPAFRQWAVQRLWQLPTLGERIKVYQLARFYRTLGMLLSGGIPIISALEMVSGLLDPSLRGQLELATINIREGQSISQSMEKHGLTTPVALRMLRVGERTGRMGEMMKRIAAFYDEELARWVDWFTRLFEPLLMVFIGLVIGIIVILMYFPIFELAGSIQ